MNTTTIMNSLKVTGAVIALAAALFFGYSVVGYVADNFSIADAVSFSCGGCDGPAIVMLDGGGGGGGYGGGGGGGGGGGYSPYCTLTVVQGPLQSASYPPINQYIFTWAAPTATAFSINNGVGSVTPASGGTYTYTTAYPAATYTGTAVTPYGTVTCSAQLPPPPQDPPYCDLSASPTSIQLGGSSVITWNTTKGTTFSINNGVGALTPVGGGTVTVSPTVTTTYTGTVVGAGGTATCNTTVTVTTPPPPPPQCTLDLTKDQISWTTTYAYQVLIVPLTNSPQIPGLSGGTPTTVVHTEGDAYTAPVFTDITQNGGATLPGPNIGFASDQATMNRVCVALHGAGSTATNIGARSYNSCGNNAVAKFNGTSWSTIPACSYNSHLSSSFSCVTGGGIQTYPLNGSYTFVPPLGTGTHTYKLTATGTGGMVMCEDTITVTDPGSCKLEITKTANKTTIAPGENVEYTINVKNTGSKKCTGSGVKIQDVLDSRLTYQSETHSTNLTAGYQSEPVYNSSNRTVSFNGWDLDPNETGWIKVVAKGTTPTTCSETVPNKAKITSYEYNNFTTWVESSVVNVTLAKDCTPPPPTECKLELTKSANVSTTSPNGLIEYTVTFKNVGTKKCTGSGVKLQDVLDPMLTYQSETHSSNVTAGYQSEPVYKSANRTVSFNAWDVDPNETGWVKIVAKAGTPTACSETVPNKAKITSYEYNNFGTWVYSNIVSVAVEKDCTPPPEKECKLEITKSVNDSSVGANDTVEYTINVKNTGTKKCTGSGVKVLDILDSRLTYQSETHSSNITAGYGSDPVYKSSARTLSWNAWDLDPNETGWIKFVAKVGTPTACTDTIPNKAKVTAYEYNNFGTWVESNVVDLTVTKDCHVPVPYCTMSIDPSAVNPGGAATLTWNTTNVSTASIDQGIGSVALSGSKTVNPTANTTYTGTFTGPGGTVTCTASITVTQSPTPQCTISASASQIKSGQSVIISWTSQNVSQGFINGIGTTTPVFGGSAEVYPSDNTTYTGTFTGSYGTVTCSVPVTVEKGGGGCQGNCGGGLNQPNVVMLQKPPEAPLAFVTLEQIPYTGFEAGKALTLAFWIAVGLLAAAITYFAMGQDMLKVAVGAAPTPWNGAYASLENDEAAEAPRSVPNTLQSVAQPVAYMPPVQVAAPTPTAVMPHVIAMPAQRPAVDGIPDLGDALESRAHGAGVLMSPEAIALALKLSTDRAEVLRKFGDILNDAVRTLPREDGWVMLTSERFEELSGSPQKFVPAVAQAPSVEAILNSVMPPVAPVAPAPVNVEMPMSVADDQAVVMSLAQSVLAGNRDQAYVTMRNLEQGGAKAASVMTVIAGAYDQLYRARRHGLTTELSVAAMHVSDEVLAKLVETFTHGMDAAYANPFTAVKLAVAQAFEIRG